jgi:hypothetical protein
MKARAAITGEPSAKGEVAGAFTIGLSSGKGKVSKGLRATIVVEKCLVH